MISQKKDGAKPPAAALVPIGWKGGLPEGLKGIQVRSRFVSLVPHIAVYGSEDVPNVRTLQEDLKPIALKDWGVSNTEMERGQPMRSLRRPGATTPPELLFFEELCETLKDLTVREDERAKASAHRLPRPVVREVGMRRTDSHREET